MTAESTVVDRIMSEVSGEVSELLKVRIADEERKAVENRVHDAYDEIRSKIICLVTKDISALEAEIGAIIADAIDRYKNHCGSTQTEINGICASIENLNAKARQLDLDPKLEVLGGRMFVFEADGDIHYAFPSYGSRLRKLLGDVLAGELDNGIGQFKG